MNERHAQSAVAVGNWMLRRGLRRVWASELSRHPNDRHYRCTCCDAIETEVQCCLYSRELPPDKELDCDAVVVEYPVCVECWNIAERLPE